METENRRQEKGTPNYNQEQKLQSKINWSSSSPLFIRHFKTTSSSAPHNPEKDKWKRMDGWMDVGSHAAAFWTSCRQQRLTDPHIKTRSGQANEEYPLAWGQRVVMDSQLNQRAAHGPLWLHTFGVPLSLFAKADKMNQVDHIK